MAREERAVRLPVAGVVLDGDLTIPAGARGVVLFAHGSGSSRHSSRNRYVAEGMQHSGFATLLMDLLPPDSAERPQRVTVVVSRGGRPDLAADDLPRVQAPTLLVVGGDDREVLGLNEQAAARLRAEPVSAGPRSQRAGRAAGLSGPGGP